MSSRLSAPAAGSRRGARLRAANPAASPSAGAHEGWEPPLSHVRFRRVHTRAGTEHRLLQPAPVPAPRPAPPPPLTSPAGRAGRWSEARGCVRPSAGSRNEAPAIAAEGGAGVRIPVAARGARGAADGAARGGRQYSPRISGDVYVRRGRERAGGSRGTRPPASTAKETGREHRISAARPRVPPPGAGAVSGERARAARHAAGSESILPAKPAEAALADASPAGRARTGLPLAREREPVRPLRAGDGGASPGARGHSLPSPGRCCPGARAQAALHHRGDVRPQPASPRRAARPPEPAGHGEGSEQACGAGPG